MLMSVSMPFTDHRGLTAGIVLLLSASVPAFSVHAQVTDQGGNVGQWLNGWFEAGSAAGLQALTYENRDGQHSPLPAGRYPQLQIFQPGPQTGPEKGPAVMLRPHPTVGNCSMSAPPDKGGSLPRHYQMDPKGSQFLMMQYLANNLMLYPEHQDHDPGGNSVGGYGDLYPSNNPCCLISQGSSGSDQPFLDAVLATLAAFPPETQALLIQKRVLMPTVQAILRQSLRPVKKPEDYFTGAAHPVVFDASWLDVEKMVKAAHDMRPPMVPPVVQMEVVDESEPQAGRDYFEAAGARPSKLATTPVFLTRIFRATAGEHHLRVSAAKSADLMGRPVTFRWAVLQGDPALVEIQPGPGKDSPEASIRLRWSPPAFTAATGMRSHRVDIGLFASNGISTSAPAILSFYMLPNEVCFRDSEGRVSEVCYQSHNPALGLPADPRDPRWLKAMLAATLAGDGLRSRIMEQLLSESERQLIQKLWLPLDERWRTAQNLEASPKQKARGEELKKKVLDDLAAALATPLPRPAAQGGNLHQDSPPQTVRSALEESYSAVGNFMGLAPTFLPELLQMAARSPKTEARARIQAEINRLRDQGALVVDASGAVSPLRPVESLTAADRHYLRGLNLTLMSEALFPDVLERSAAPAWADPRLTTPKPWRDVYRYTPEGKLRGWVRHQAGRTHWFNPEGKLLPEGPDKPELAKEVTYEKNSHGLLEWRAP